MAYLGIGVESSLDALRELTETNSGEESLIEGLGYCRRHEDASSLDFIGGRIQTYRGCNSFLSVHWCECEIESVLSVGEK